MSISSVNSLGMSRKLISGTVADGIDEPTRIKNKNVYYTDPNFKSKKL